MQVNGDTYMTDQGLRETHVEALATLKPAFKQDGKVTAGNSSQVSDGAAAVLLMSREKADALGLKPRARIFDQTTVGVDPVIMLTGPIPATRKLLERNTMTIGRHRPDRDQRGLRLGRRRLAARARARHGPGQRQRRRDRARPSARLDRARLMTTLLHELERSDKEIGLVTMCCGGGLGTGTLIQRI